MGLGDGLRSHFASPRVEPFVEVDAFDQAVKDEDGEHIVTGYGFPGDQEPRYNVGHPDQMEALDRDMRRLQARVVRNRIVAGVAVVAVGYAGVQLVPRSSDEVSASFASSEPDHQSHTTRPDKVTHDPKVPATRPPFTAAPRPVIEPKPVVTVTAKPRVITRTEIVKVPGPERTRTVEIPGPVRTKTITKEVPKEVDNCFVFTDYKEVAGELVPTEKQRVDCADPLLKHADEVKSAAKTELVVQKAAYSLLNLLRGKIGDKEPDTPSPTASTSALPSQTTPSEAAKSPSKTTGPGSAETSPSKTATAPAETKLKKAVHSVTRRVFVANQLGSSHTRKGGNKPKYLPGRVRSKMMARQVLKHDADLVFLTENESDQARAFLKATKGKFGMEYAGKDTRNAVAFRHDAYENVTSEHRQHDSYSNVYFDGDHWEDPIVWLKDRATGQLVIALPIHNPANTKHHHRQRRHRDHATAIEQRVIHRLREAHPEATITIGGDWNDKGRADLRLFGGRMERPVRNVTIRRGKAPIDRVQGFNVEFDNYQNIHGPAIDRITDHHHVYTADFTTPVPHEMEPQPEPAQQAEPRIIDRDNDKGRPPATKSEWLGDVHRSFKGARAILKRQIKANGEKKPAIVLDIDNTSEATRYDYGKPVQDVLGAAKYAHNHGLAVLYATGRTEGAQVKQGKRLLKKSGYPVTEVCGRDNPKISLAAGKQACRELFAKKGYSILMNIGNRDSDLKDNPRTHKDDYNVGIKLPSYEGAHQLS